MRWYTPSDVGTNDERFRRLRRQVTSGEVDLVVTLRNNPRARNTRIYDYVREHGEPIATAPMWPRNAVSNLGEELVVYEMGTNATSG